jgi:hypothetical protein
MQQLEPTKKTPFTFGLEKKYPTINHPAETIEQRMQSSLEFSATCLDTKTMRLETWCIESIERA